MASFIDTTEIMNPRQEENEEEAARLVSEYRALKSKLRRVLDREKSLIEKLRGDLQLAGLQLTFFTDATLLQYLYLLDEKSFLACMLADQGLVTGEQKARIRLAYRVHKDCADLEKLAESFERNRERLSEIVFELANLTEEQIALIERWLRLDYIPPRN